MAALFTITFTPVGGNEVTLGDVEARHTVVIHSWAGMAVEDVVHMFEQAAPKRLMLDNVQGDFVFTSELEQADRGAMLSYFMGQRLLLNQVGTLVVTIDGVAAVMQNATCSRVDPSGFGGVRWALKYTFGITLIDPPVERDPAA
jgi:hypothetical protein